MLAARFDPGLGTPVMGRFFIDSWTRASNLADKSRFFTPCILMAAGAISVNGALPPLEPHPILHLDDLLVEQLQPFLLLQLLLLRLELLYLRGIQDHLLLVLLGGTQLADGFQATNEPIVDFFEVLSLNFGIVNSGNLPKHPFQTSMNLDPVGKVDARLEVRFSLSPRGPISSYLFPGDEKLEDPLLQTLVDGVGFEIRAV